MGFWSGMSLTTKANDGERAALSSERCFRATTVLIKPFDDGVKRMELRRRSRRGDAANVPGHVRAAEVEDSDAGDLRTRTQRCRTTTRPSTRTRSGETWARCVAGPVTRRHSLAPELGKVVRKWCHRSGQEDARQGGSLTGGTTSFSGAVTRSNCDISLGS